MRKIKKEKEISGKSSRRQRKLRTFHFIALHNMWALRHKKSHFISISLVHPKVFFDFSPTIIAREDEVHASQTQIANTLIDYLTMLINWILDFILLTCSVKWNERCFLSSSESIVRSFRRDGRENSIMIANLINVRFNFRAQSTIEDESWMMFWYPRSIIIEQMSKAFALSYFRSSIMRKFI